MDKITKSNVLADFAADLKKSRGALIEVLDHNRVIDKNIVNDLIQGDYTRLEEHIEISKIIMDGVKGFNDLYKNTPQVLDSISKLPDDNKSKAKVSLSDVMGELTE